MKAIVFYPTYISAGFRINRKPGELSSMRIISGSGMTAYTRIKYLPLTLFRQATTLVPD